MEREEVKRVRKPRRFLGITFQLNITGLRNNILTCGFWHWMDNPNYALRQQWNLNAAKKLHKWLGQAITYLESKKHENLKGDGE